MSKTPQSAQISRDELIAIRQARRYLKQNTGVLARILNAYHTAHRSGTGRGYLPSK